ncbi:MAG: hypothetical protein J3R72DRAFT_364997, partial [Linnemannia gamsii]
ASVPNPTPANECNVHPPILQAAIPVDAVTATASLALMLSQWLPDLANTDLPVPADPVKNKFL